MIPRIWLMASYTLGMGCRFRNGGDDERNPDPHRSRRRGRTADLGRPVTAIRAAATDGNPETEADPNWLPEVGNTTPDPSYPGAHAVISAAGAEVSTSFFHTDHFEFSVTSEVLAGVHRSFTSFSAAAEEATLSRIFAGVHFLFDLTTGQRLGSDVADLAVDNFLTSRHRDD